MRAALAGLVVATSLLLGVDTVTVGGADPSRLVLPGLGAAPVFAG
jgi:hypothetical protein